MDTKDVNVTKPINQGTLATATTTGNKANSAQDSEAERSGARHDQSAPPPSAYTESPPAPQAQPLSLAEDVRADVRALAVGDPKETISVPMVHSTETVNFKKLFSKNRKTVTQSVIVRKMSRDHYLKHYAKDAEGNYVGTEKPAVDAGLVFVPSKSTSDDLLQQVRKVAFGKQHHASDFSAGANMIPFMMNTAGSAG